MIDVSSGHLSLGEQPHPRTRTRNGEPVRLEAADLTTHGVVVGMTGSDTRAAARSLVWIPVG